MSVSYQIEPDNLMVFDLSGEYGQAEHQQILSSVQTAINKLGTVKLLFRLKEFQGWEKATGWEAESGLIERDENIAGLAIVGDDKWRDQAEMFTFKGMRKAPVEYFVDGQEQAARDWLANQ